MIWGTYMKEEEKISRCEYIAELIQKAVFYSQRHDFSKMIKEWYIGRSFKLTRADRVIDDTPGFTVKLYYLNDLVYTYDRFGNTITYPVYKKGSWEKSLENLSLGSDKENDSLFNILCLNIFRKGK